MAICARCLCFKALEATAPLVHVTAHHALELIHMDYLKLEPSSSQQENALVITDHYTHYTQAYPTCNQTARTTAHVFWEHFVLHYGFPDQIISDQGWNFESALIHELCQIAGVRKVHMTPYHPQCNGQSECFNGTLINMLGTLDPVEKCDWKSHIQAIVHAYNCIHSDATGFSPYYLMFGRPPWLPIDIAFGLPAQPFNASSTSRYVQDLHCQICHAYELMTKTQEAQQSCNCHHYDHCASAYALNSGDLVLLCNMGFYGQHKIQDWWSLDPYEVVDHLDASILVYHLHPISSAGPTKTIYHNLLLPLSLPPSAPVLAGEGLGDSQSTSLIAFSSHHFTLPSSASLQPFSSAVDDTTPVVWPSMQMTGVDGTEMGSDMLVMEDEEEDDSYHWDGFSLFSSDESSEDKHDDPSMSAEGSDALSVESFVSVTSTVLALPSVMEDPDSDSSSSMQSSHSQQHLQCWDIPFVCCSSHMTKGVLSAPTLHALDTIPTLF